MATYLVRGVLKSFGARATNKAAPQFHTWIADKIPTELRGAMDPILATLTTVNEQIKVLDKELIRLTKEVYPETQLLQQVNRSAPCEWWKQTRYRIAGTVSRAS